MEQHEKEVKQITVQVQSFVPVMTMTQFGELAGMTYDSVKSQVINGNLPSIKIGKKRMVNVVALTEMAKLAIA
ncbi:hypothetical protein [Methylomonas rapida]|uniref:DNA-binding protein n=1 Tax=Methylomonas rapida TaxID=2963939 RepID=A0ABY7GH38_9GAMM|nr:hypothetical protein [Methylomonas rapida]WAR44577.1 hypothetical protein NM686_019860 [Methylomonas rapida]